MCVFSRLPQELATIIFGFLGSKCRSMVSSVSNYFERMSIESSKFASTCPELFDAKELSAVIIDSKTKSILTQGDYHLIVRLKSLRIIRTFYWTGFFYVACKTGDLDILELMTKKAKEKTEYKFEWSEGLKIACKHGHLDIAKLMVDNLMINYDVKSLYLEKGFFSACKGGHFTICRLMVEKGASWIYCVNCGKPLKDH
jgi:hypothetical protein